MTPGFILFLLILFTGMFGSVKKNKLTMGGAITGGVIGCLVFAGAYLTGIAMMGLFFVLGTTATAWKINLKEGFGAAERDSGKRTGRQVIANGGVAGIAGLLSWFFPAQGALCQLLIAASFASATADTLSSELGTIYGKRFYNILSFRPDKRGENGVVSLEGTLIGIVGSTLIALVHAAGFGWSSQFGWIVAAGTVGNISDSVLGAALERKHYMGNDAVNFLNTLIAAMFAWMLRGLF